MHRRSLRHFLLLFLVLGAAQYASAIPAFARKYGLRCSACHEAWPKLNAFGQAFKDNGYQLGNDRDAPIFQQPSYFPITFRITPQWHRETINRSVVDLVPGNPAAGQQETPITTSGFDLSGIDIWAAGTIEKNISFLVLPSSDATGAFHFESAWVRFDNLFGSRWANLKFGKFELDTPISEKRILALSNNGGVFQLYHFLPVGDSNAFGGIGDNQLGVELMGHSRNSYTRYAISLLSSNDGQPGLPAASTYDVYLHLSQGFEIGSLGLQRIGVYDYTGRTPTFFQTSGGTPIPGSGTGARSFYRAGAYGIWYIRQFDFSTLYMHGMDNAFLGTGTAANSPLPSGAQSPEWNGALLEAHYTFSPQLVLVSRYEGIRVQRQALPTGTVLSNGLTESRSLGNVDSEVIGYRWYPIMTSRAGIAWHQEYAHLRTHGTAPLTGRDVGSSSFFSGFDFDF